jgi:cobalt/nickel transport system ATP-binding protein
MAPEVLILDEPTNGLDESTTKRIVRRLVDSNLTYVLISHDREVVERTTDIMMTIRDGRVIPVKEKSEQLLHRLSL